jgi:hypothetical protein
MSTMLTDLMQHLQDVHTRHPNDHARVIVAVPTTAHRSEQFEVEKVRHDGSSVVLHCQPLREEPAPTQEEPARSPREKTRPPFHNDYDDLV